MGGKTTDRSCYPDPIEKSADATSKSQQSSVLMTARGSEFSEVDAKAIIRTGQIRTSPTGDAILAPHGHNLPLSSWTKIEAPASSMNVDARRCVSHGVR